MAECSPLTIAEWLTCLPRQILDSTVISRADALRLLGLPPEFSEELLAAADELRRSHAGNRIKTCSIINAKSGRCSENCSFCAQSVGPPIGSGQPLSSRCASHSQAASVYGQP